MAEKSTNYANAVAALVQFEREQGASVREPVVMELLRSASRVDEEGRGPASTATWLGGFRATLTEDHMVDPAVAEAIATLDAAVLVRLNEAHYWRQRTSPDVVEAMTAPPTPREPYWREALRSHGVDVDALLAGA